MNIRYCAFLPWAKLSSQDGQEWTLAPLDGEWVDITAIEDAFRRLINTVSGEVKCVPYGDQESGYLS